MYMYLVNRWKKVGPKVMAIAQMTLNGSELTILKTEEAWLNKEKCSFK